MSKSPTPTNSKRGRPRVKSLKVRQNISISPLALKMARKIAFGQGLALSTWIEQMVREQAQASTEAKA